MPTPNPLEITTALLSHKALILKELSEIKQTTSLTHITSLETAMPQDLFLRQIQRGLNQHFQQELQTIQKILKRIETGDYGKCFLCGYLIEKDRLAGNPMTGHCMACENTTSLVTNGALPPGAQLKAANDEKP